MATFRHRGQLRRGKSEPTEPATRTIVAAFLTLPGRERAPYRAWMLRWTDYSGRIITPQEPEIRLETIRAQHEQVPTTKRRR
jgi:hypothetical protein